MNITIRQTPIEKSSQFDSDHHIEPVFRRYVKLRITTGPLRERCIDFTHDNKPQLIPRHTLNCGRLVTNLSAIIGWSSSKLRCNLHELHFPPKVRFQCRLIERKKHFSRTTRPNYVR